ncbi:Uncharacterised protein [Mycobacteroides abscessus subsp. abscessus]|nr:Uncharacterised protein [Mycobacteroides abscessus subsp. abscessus]
MLCCRPVNMPDSIVEGLVLVSRSHLLMKSDTALAAMTNRPTSFSSRVTMACSSFLNPSTFLGSEKKSSTRPAMLTSPLPSIFRVSPRPFKATSNLDTPSGPTVVKSLTHLLNEAPVSENHLPISGSLLENPLIRSRNPWVKSRIPGAAAVRPLAMLRIV